jgi:hypothetical protein
VKAMMAQTTMIQNAPLTPVKPSDFLAGAAAFFEFAIIVFNLLN